MTLVSGADTPRKVRSVRVLLVEDELAVALAIRDGLAHVGYDVTLAGTGEIALEELERRSHDVVVLDVRLPGASGLETCRQIRARSGVPIIMASGLGEPEERIAGFAAGADDYVVKPVDPHELAYRIRALLRRFNGSLHERLVQGPYGVTLDARSHEACVDGEPLDLTPKEFQLLEHLLRHRGEVLSSDALSLAIWGYETLGSRNFVEAHVSRLRAKLRHTSAQELITTVRGVGYVVRPE